MSEESNTNTDELQESDNNSPSPNSSYSQEQAEKLPKRVLLAPYPKFIFMYPTLIVSTIAAIVLSLFGYQAVDPQEHTLVVVITGLFFVVLMINTFILVFDFPRATSLTLIAVSVSALLGSWILVIAKPSLLPAIAGLVTTVRPVAHASFFICI